MSEKYDVILADPPWMWPKRNPGKRFGMGITGRYLPMKTADIAAMGSEATNGLPPIRELGKKNSVLFMWTTSHHMTGHKGLNAGYVMEQWGYRFACVGMIWIKVDKKSTLNANLRSGSNINARVMSGNYTGQNAEFLLIGVRGSCLPEIAGTSTPQVVFHPRMPHHSEKPPVFRTRIERMYPDAKRIELFARHRVDGWDAWGDQVGILDEGGETHALVGLADCGADDGK